MTVQRVGILAGGWSLATTDAHGTSIALETDRGTVLIDGGGEVTKGLARFSGLEGVERIYLTHEHTDHTWGLPGLLHCLRFSGQTDPIPIHGPEAALDVLRAGLEALGVETPYGLDWTPLDGAAGEDDLVSWQPADHSVPCVSYRLDDVVVCGDTRPTDATRRLASGASLLIHEASFDEPEFTHKAGHSTPEDAARIATEADVDTLALIHVHPDLGRRRAEELSTFDPTITPKDGDVLIRQDGRWSLSA